ncbi:MAG: hypothetical protein ACPGVT_00505 [Maricaulaceae bacterium]
MRNRAFITPLTAGLMACLSACATTPMKADMQDAVLITPSAGTHKNLTAAVSQALNGIKVMIAPQELTRHSTLIIDPPGMQDMATGGRSTARPDHFDLKTAQGKCLLVHRQTGTVFPLKTATCRPANPEDV